MSKSTKRIFFQNTCCQDIVLSQRNYSLRNVIMLIASANLKRKTSEVKALT